MKIPSFVKKYRFHDDVLVEGFPGYLQEPIASWISKTLEACNLIYGNGISHFDIIPDFHNHLQTSFREIFPTDVNSVVRFVFSDTDRGLVFIQMLLAIGGAEYPLKGYDSRSSRMNLANELEVYLSQGGSAYAVVNIGSEDQAEYELQERAPSTVRQQAEEVISNNEKLALAWRACYGVNPNYKETVQQCQNVLEELLRDTYLPNDQKAQLGRLIGNIRATDKIKMVYVGDSILGETHNKILLELINNIPQFRGIHTAGTGQDPSKEDAVYILHTTIYFWLLHHQKQTFR